MSGRLAARELYEHAACTKFRELPWTDDPVPQHARPAMRAVCSACPVQLQCLDLAMQVETDKRATIMGGLTPSQRRELARVWDQSKPAAEQTAHATLGRFLLGCRCQPCRQVRADMITEARTREPAVTPAHGTRPRYRQGCRCDECRAASAAYERELLARPLDGGPRGPMAAGHGSRRYYRQGCRCDECLGAMRARWKLERERALMRQVNDTD